MMSRPIDRARSRRYAHVALLLSACYAGRDAEGPAIGGVRDDAFEPPADGVIVEVLDIDDRPLPGASVGFGCDCPGAAASVTCELRLTDREGRTTPFEHSGGRLLACVEAAGHAPATVVLDLRAHARLEHTVHLLPRGEPLVPKPIPGGYQVERSGVRITFAADSVRDHDGRSVGGDFTVTIADLDPAADRPGLRAAPGPLRTAGGAVLLESVRMADISLWRGEETLQLDPARPATLAFELSPEHPAYTRLPPGSTVPLWWFDLNAGEWVREGEGVVSEADRVRSFTAAVTHFSWWNADVPVAEKDCFDVQLVLDKGAQSDFLGDIPITLEGTNYAGVSLAVTDAGGHACLEAPEGDYVGQPPGTSFEIYAGTLDGLIYESEVVSFADSDGFASGAPNDSETCGGKTCIPVVLTLKAPICSANQGFTDWHDIPPQQQEQPCAPDTYKCIDEVWVKTGTFQGPEPEQDDGIDNDCNGLVDEGLDNCIGPPPDVIACHDERPFGLCRPGTWKCQGTLQCLDAANLPMYTPIASESGDYLKTDDDEDCDGWPNPDLSYLLLGGPEEQILTDAARWGGGLALVGTNRGTQLDYRYLDANKVPQVGSQPVLQPYFVARHVPGLPPKVGAIAFDHDANTPHARPIAVITQGGEALVAGLCVGAGTLPDQTQIACGLGALFVARLDSELKTVKTSVFPQAPTTALDHISIATAADRVYIAGAFENGALSDGVNPPLDPSGEDGFILRLNAALAPVLPPLHVRDGDLLGSSQRVTALHVDALGDLYFGGAFEGDLHIGGLDGPGGPGVFLARLKGDTLEAPVAITAETPCQLRDLDHLPNDRLAVGLHGCDGLQTSNGAILPASPGFAHLLRVDLAPDPTNWSWGQTDVFRLRASKFGELHTIAPVGNDLLAAGLFLGELHSPRYGSDPLVGDGGFLARYEFPDGRDPWAIAIPSTIPLARVQRVVRLGNDQLLVAGDHHGELELDTFPPIGLPSDDSQDVFVLAFPLPNLQ